MVEAARGARHCFLFLGRLGNTRMVDSSRPKQKTRLPVGPIAGAVRLTGCLRTWRPHFLEARNRGRTQEEIAAVVGKELSDWVAKLFEVRIKPTTLEKRAERQKEKFPTNVGKKSNDETKTISYEQQESSLTHPIGELAKYETLKNLNDNNRSDLINLLDLKNQENQFQSLKSKGVGQTTILKFLGGNWKQWVT